MKFPDGYILECEYEDCITEVKVTMHTKDLIRCKDCRHFEPYNGRKDGMCNYKRMTTCGELSFNTEPDEYCSLAERKKVEYEIFSDN